MIDLNKMKNEIKEKSLEIPLDIIWIIDRLFTECDRLQEENKKLRESDSDTERLPCLHFDKETGNWECRDRNCWHWM